MPPVAIGGSQPPYRVGAGACLPCCRGCCFLGLDGAVSLTWTGLPVVCGYDPNGTWPGAFAAGTTSRLLYQSDFPPRLPGPDPVVCDPGPPVRSTLPAVDTCFNSDRDRLTFALECVSGREVARVEYTAYKLDIADCPGDPCLKSNSQVAYRVQGYQPPVGRSYDGDCCVYQIAVEVRHYGPFGNDCRGVRFDASALTGYVLDYTAVATLRICPAGYGYGTGTETGTADPPVLLEWVP